ncbi:hypothetical protein D3C76_1023010 [compost metagenome]
MQGQKARHLHEKSQYRPGHDDLARINRAGLGDEGNGRQYGQQDQPASQQPADPDHQAMTLVVDLHHAVDRHRAEHGQDHQGAVFAGQTANTPMHEQHQQRDGQRHRTQPLPPERQASAVCHLSGIERCHGLDLEAKINASALMERTRRGSRRLSVARQR